MNIYSGLLFHSWNKW